VCECVGGGIDEHVRMSEQVTMVAAAVGGQQDNQQDQTVLGDWFTNRLPIRRMTVSS
jgi:hypothetical protein